MDNLRTWCLENSLVKTISDRCECFGYTLRYAYQDKRFGEMTPEISFFNGKIDENGYREENRFLPEIYLNSFHRNGESPKFGMQTTAYGTLYGKDLEEYATKIQMGLLLVQWLNSLNLDELPVYEDN